MNKFVCQEPVTKPTKNTYIAYSFGTRVQFGGQLQGEVIEVKFVGPDASTAYVVEWWDSDGGQNTVELYEEQIKVVGEVKPWNGEPLKNMGPPTFA